MNSSTPNKQPNFVAEVHNSQMKIRLCIGKDDLTLDTYELETVIRALVERRAMMLEPVSAELDPNAAVNPLMNPTTIVGDITVGEKAGQQSMVVIATRNPGFGWMSAAYSKESVRAVVKGIEDVLKKIDPMRAGSGSLILPGQ